MDRMMAPPALDQRATETDEAGRSFEDFFEAHHVTLFRALWLITHERFEAEDLMQDAFLRLWERWDRVERMDDPTGYLYRTAMNGLRSRRRRALTALRKAMRDRPVADAFEEIEGRDAVVRALAVLAPRQRAVVVLKHVLGMTTAEAAAALRITPSTVRVLAARAMARLRREVEEADGQPG